MIILICDDQKSVHTFLSSGMDWKSLDITELLHARNGDQCLKLIESRRPDILLLDIKMPGKDGMEVLRALDSAEHNIGIILLSSYSDFEYARQALRMGAFDYELKPIDIPRLSERIHALSHMQRNRYLSAIRDLILGITTRLQPADEVLHRLGVGDYRGLLVSFQNTDGAEFTQQAEECLGEYFKTVIKIGEHDFFVLFSVNGRTDNEIIHAAREQYQALSITFPSCPVTLAISTQLHGDRSLKTAYDQCVHAMEQGFRSQEGCFLYDAQDHAAMEMDCIIELRQHIHNGLVNNMGETHVVELIDQLFEKLAISRMKSTDIIDICFEILHYNISIIHSDNTATELSLRRELQTCRNLEQLKSKVINTIRERFYDDITYELSQTPLESVRKFIEASYMEQLSLDSLSKQFLVSKYDLCRRFRKEFDEGIWDYIKRIRMEKAHWLLLNSNLKIYEIAENVGYNDANYFSNMFRKYYGCSPLQMKRDLSEK